MMLPEFAPFAKIPRWKRDVIITEKLDGTNAQVCIQNGVLYYGSRNRWITPANDNFGFAAWCTSFSEELLKLGEGRHYGEWYGNGIQRGYGLREKRFALFNTARWNKDNPPPWCCSVVPVLYHGSLDESGIDTVLDSLIHTGSVAVPGFMDPEGIVIYHSASRSMYKRTCKQDSVPKSEIVAV
jgi:hypothetical protein